MSDISILSEPVSEKNAVWRVRVRNKRKNRHWKSIRRSRKIRAKVDVYKSIGLTANVIASKIGCRQKLVEELMK